MRYHSLFLLLFLFVISSCSKSDDIITERNQSLENILTEHLLRNPSQIRISDNAKIVIMDEFGVNGFIKILDQDWKVLHSVGKLGEGPDEFSSYPSLSTSDIGQVYVFDGFKNKLYSLDINSGALIQEKFLVPERDIVEELISISNTDYVFQPGGHQDLFTKISREISVSKETFPLSIKNSHFQSQDNTKKLTFSSNYLTKKPNEELYASVFNYYDELLITDGKEIKFHETLFDNLLYDSDQTNIAFTAIASTDQNIYAVYYGKNVTELENPSQCNLLVFDWKGKLKENIALDHPLNFITVDQKNKIIYGLNPMNEDNPIYKLKME
ncbi:BF3164 family lipoprotein [Belliella pelovolcani]|uniref:BF3164 family lipoprotein n=1 Tax=Belliella pelovolcani TaxID=529505 RepID=UPI003919EF70